MLEEHQNTENTSWTHFGLTTNILQEQNHFKLLT